MSENNRLRGLEFKDGEEFDAKKQGTIVAATSRQFDEHNDRITEIENNGLRFSNVGSVGSIDELINMNFAGPTFVSYTIGGVNHTAIIVGTTGIYYELS